MTSAEIKNLWIGDQVFIRSKGRNGVFEGETSPGLCRVKIGEDIDLYDASDIFEYDPSREAKAQTISEDPIGDGDFDLLANANFPRRLDLHIEVLNVEYARKSAGEILRYQIERAKQYVNEAFDLYVDTVYIIHGKGSGILRDTLIDVFMDYEYVDSCRSATSAVFGNDLIEVKITEH